jgi:hypothetical protein
MIYLPQALILRDRQLPFRATKSLPNLLPVMIMYQDQ